MIDPNCLFMTFESLPELTWIIWPIQPLQLQDMT
jgi:hypothetical protein